MYYDEDALMNDFDKWNDQTKRQRFLNKMKHKLNAKENRF